MDVTSNGEAAIEVRGLRKSYGDFEAVAGIDLRVDRGEIFALLTCACSICRPAVT